MVEHRQFDDLICDNSISDMRQFDNSICDNSTSDMRLTDMRYPTVGKSEIGKSEIGKSEINILELLPQRNPFIMVDALTHFDEVFTHTCMQVMKDNIFVENNMLTESGVIENIAQTCAARMGYINKYIHKNPVKIGFIGSIKNLVIEELPKVGDELKTTIEVLSEVFAITLVNAKVEVNDKLMASGEMKISITDMSNE